MVESLAFLEDVHLFQEEVQLVLSILSQILGYDDDKSMNEVMIGLLLKTNLSEPETNQVYCFGFNEFLATAINFKLAYFPKLRHFRYHSYLLNMFLCLNVSNLHFINTIFSPGIPG